MFTIIVAVGKNLEIGADGKLMWYIPEDLKFFKDTTINHKIVMGRKTYEGLPNGALKNRKNIVVSNSKLDFSEEIELVNDFNKFLKDNQESDEEIFIIGGATLYKQSMDHFVDKMYITRIDKEYPEADTFFSEINYKLWIKENIGIFEYNGINYTREVYTRK